MKIGILTHYYNSKNYGGNLQAYALCHVLRQRYDLDAEQISYDSIAHRRTNWHGITIKRITAKLNRIFRKAHIDEPLVREASQQIARRRQAFVRFNHELIPHSERVYTCLDIEDAGKVYDMFVTGSDQVWHPEVACAAYLLEFVPEGKKKFSYAASTASDKLPHYFRKRLKRALQTYEAVSVREQEAVSQIEPLATVPVVCTVDPVLLMSAQEWDTVCAPQQVKSSYLFCYFLGDGEQPRQLALEYAARQGLTVVTLPYLSDGYRSVDENFGDIRLFDVSPEKFISLIKYAACIFTDSFHGAAFSTLYQKKCFIFQRSGRKEASSRLYSLVRLAHREAFFCDTDEKCCMDYVLNTEQRANDYDTTDLEAAIHRSGQFLESQIKRGMVGK